MQALARLQLQVEQVVGVAALHAKGFTGFHTPQQSNESLAHTLLDRHSSGQSLLIFRVAGPVTVRPPQFSRQGFGGGVNALADLAHVVFEGQQPHVAFGQITFHDRRVVERAQRAAQPQPIIAGEMTDDLRTIWVQEGFQAVVPGDGEFSFHTPVSPGAASAGQWCCDGVDNSRKPP